MLAFRCSVLATNTQPDICRLIVVACKMTRHGIEDRSLESGVEIRSTFPSLLQSRPTFLPRMIVNPPSAVLGVWGVGLILECPDCQKGTLS